MFFFRKNSELIDLKQELKSINGEIFDNIISIVGMNLLPIIFLIVSILLYSFSNFAIPLLVSLIIANVSVAIASHKIKKNIKINLSRLVLVKEELESIISEKVTNKSIDHTLSNNFVKEIPDVNMGSYINKDDVNKIYEEEYKGSLKQEPSEEEKLGNLLRSFIDQDSIQQICEDSLAINYNSMIKAGNISKINRDINGNSLDAIEDKGFTKQLNI